MRWRCSFAATPGCRRTPPERSSPRVTATHEPALPDQQPSRPGCRPGPCGSRPTPSPATVSRQEPQVSRGSEWIRLIDLHGAGQPVSTRSHEHGAQTVEHGPSSLVGADLESPLEGERRDAVFRRSELPAGRKPHRERRPSSIEERAGRDSGLRLAARALVAPVSDDPAAEILAARTYESFRPAEPREVVQTVLVGREP